VTARSGQAFIAAAGQHNSPPGFKVPKNLLALTEVNQIEGLKQPFANMNQHSEPLRPDGVALLFRVGRSMMAATKSSGSKRGFAAMDPAKQREIASKGGKASHGGGRRPSASR